MNTLLTVVLLVVSRAWGENCHQWSVCSRQPPSDPADPANPVKRGKMGPRGEKGNPGKDLSREVESLVAETLMLGSKVLELNGTLSAQRAKVHRLEQRRGEMNEIVTKQSTQIQELMQALARHEEKTSSLFNITSAQLASQANKLETLEEVIKNQTKYIKTVLKSKKRNSECRLPNITHTAHRTPGKIAHNSSVELTCADDFLPVGLTRRNCRSGGWSPGFSSHPFACRELSFFMGSFDSANKTCRDFGTTLIYKDIETTEKRKAICRKYGTGRGTWTGIRKSSDGIWRYPDGRNIEDNFQLDWMHGYPWKKPDPFKHDAMMIYCYENYNFGKLFTPTESHYFAFLCQN